MKTMYYFILVSVLQFSLKSHCVENNVCKTIQDYYTIRNNPNCEYDVAADPYADPVKVITFNGYPVETHKVTTLDGYILTLYRIPNYQVTSKRGPVFLQHGLLTSSATFLGLRKHSLAFVLADAGYDVWLGNYRGTEYSEEHVNLTVFNQQYWNYSADEIGLYDTPAQLDYVSKATGNKGDIVYIGHSLATNVGLIYASTFLEQANRTLKLLILVAPGASQSGTRAPIFTYLRALFRPLFKIIMNNDLIRLVSQANVMRSSIRQFCLSSPVFMQRCIDLLNLLFAGPRSQMDPKAIPVFFNQVPTGSSFKILVQIADFIMGNFRRFDYGSTNYEKYHSYEPPPYNLTKINVPVFLVYAINDWVITPEDTLNLYNNLPPKVRHGKHEITVSNFNHMDFLYGKNAKSIVYDVILQVLDGLKVV